MEWMIWVKRFLIFPKGPQWLWGPPSLLFHGDWGSFPDVKWPGHVTDRLSQSSVKSKKVCSYATTTVCLNGVLQISATVWSKVTNLLDPTQWKLYMVTYMYSITFYMHSQNYEKWRLAVHPHETTWLPVDGFRWNQIFFRFSRKSIDKI